MANHIINTITVRFSKEQEEIAENILQILAETDNIANLYESPEFSRGWFENHIGAKWARIQDMELSENQLYLNIESAWNAIDSFVFHLSGLFSDECDIRHEWVDESPTYFGYRVYEQGSVSDEFERYLSEEELEQEFRKCNPDKDLTEDNLWDWQWDWCYDQILE